MSDQLRFSFSNAEPPPLSGDTRERLTTPLDQDLDFHGHDSLYGAHPMHAFPAKFPPQVPKLFIEGLTSPGDTVVDPMMGSGTAVVEAIRAGRRAIGIDLDPLARLITRVKVTPLDVRSTAEAGRQIVKGAQASLRASPDALREALDARWNAKSRAFVDYWFAPRTQIELEALKQEIERIETPTQRDFFTLVFSSLIVTKSGGVSMAIDLAHTRPHRAKVVHDHTGECVLSADTSNLSERRLQILTKTLRSPIAEFKKRVPKKLQRVPSETVERGQAAIVEGDAQSAPVEDETADLIVTSPPYAANAIDYMRAHKFSLVWMGHPIKALGQHRKKYIGGEAVTQVEYEDMPPRTAAVVDRIAATDEKKARVLHRYYSEMVRTLSEMHRILKPGAAALVVVGSSRMRGLDTQTEQCLADIGETIGFDVPAIGVRNLDRDRRMMPASASNGTRSQIQKRMHQEFVIGFHKPSVHDKSQMILRIPRVSSF